MTENTATVAQDLQRVAAAASKLEKVELPLATLRDDQLGWRSRARVSSCSRCRRSRSGSRPAQSQAA